MAATPLAGVQMEPEELRGRDFPDIALVRSSGPVRDIVQTTECKTKWVNCAATSQLDPQPVDSFLMGC